MGSDPGQNVRTRHGSCCSAGVHIRRRRSIIIATTVGALTIAAAVSLATRIPFSSDALRKRVVAALADRLDAEVELRELTLHVYPRLHANGEGLTVRFGRRRRPTAARVHRPLHRCRPGGALATPRRQDGPDGTRHQHSPHGEVERRHRSVPPDASRRSGISPRELGRQRTRDRRTRRAGFATYDLATRPRQGAARLVHASPDDEKRGPGFEIPFETLLTNAVPPGQSLRPARLGHGSAPTLARRRSTGASSFDNADLSVFKGISGILSSRGTFDGTLPRLDVDGQTETPDFMVNLSHHQVPLRTSYHAMVDGTNGNTTLDEVRATVLETGIVAKGGVYEVNGVHGRMVKLDVTIDNGRLEDVMRLAVNTPGPR